MDCYGASLDSPEACEHRRQMVEQQLKRRRIRDERVLEAFRRIPRHVFCPPGINLATAYGDHPLEIGEGQTISQPLMVADMTQALELAPQAKVLEIGTGSGYQAAILALLAREVHTVERVVALSRQACERFGQIGLTNIVCHIGDGTCGWPDQAPYDAIVVTAASPQIPEPLKEQLADGGRLVIPVGDRYMQDLVMVHRQGDRFDVHTAGGCRFVPLIGVHGWER